MIPIDKQEHMAAGFITGGLIITNKSIKHPFWTSVIAATSVGVIKELYDREYNGVVDTKDIYFTTAGGVITGSIGYLIKRHREKRKHRYHMNMMIQRKIIHY
jgi:hypothetical protein